METSTNGNGNHQDQISFEEMEDIKAEVRDMYPDIPFPNVYKDHLHRGISNLRKVPNRYMVIMERDGEEMETEVVSGEYRLVPHEYAIHRFQTAVKEVEEYGVPILNIKLYSEGAKMMMVATFPDAPANLGMDDIKPRAGIKNSYDLSMEWEHFFGGMVERCTNGLLMYKKLVGHRQKHRLNLDVEANVSAITAGMEQMSIQYDIWNKWAALNLDPKHAITLLEGLPLVSDKQQEAIRALPETGTNNTIDNFLKVEKPINGWFLNSVITQWLTHEMEDTPANLERETRITAYLHGKKGLGV